MKRQRSDELIQTGFYGLSSYAYGTGWDEPRYVRLKNETEDPLEPGSKIQILWPNNKITDHTLTEFTTEIVSGYEPDAYLAYSFGYMYPHISVDFNGTSLKQIKLHTINDIKVRIVPKN